MLHGLNTIVYASADCFCDYSEFVWWQSHSITLFWLFQRNLYHQASCLSLCI